VQEKGGSMPTISEVARELGVSREQLHYLIGKKQIIRPSRQGNRYTLSDQDVEILRGHVRKQTVLTGALVMAQVRGVQLKEAVDEIYEQTREMVWCAGAWGEHSLIAFLELPKFDNIGDIIYNIQRLGYINYTQTYLVSPGEYHVKDMIPQDCERLALVLLKVVDALYRARHVISELTKMPNIIRYGALLGPWDIFAEVRYKDVDHLFSIVMEEVYRIKDVTDTTSILTMPKGRGLRREKDTLRQS
jgi:DNA-binding Lrp family transcriptional regulator